MLQIPGVPISAAQILATMPSWGQSIGSFHLGSLTPGSGLGQLIVTGTGLLSAVALALASELRTVRWRFWVLVPLNLLAAASLAIGISYVAVLLFGLGVAAVGIMIGVLVGLVIVMALASA